MFHLAEIDLGNVAYIIMAVLYVLYSLYTGSKKKDKTGNTQQESTSTSPRPKTKSPLEEFLEKVKDQYEQTTTQTDYPQNDRYEEEVAPMEYKPMATFKPVKKAPSMINTERTAYKSLDKTKFLKDDVWEEQDVTINGIEAREAFIASEILKRPEY
jgi:hypothetical protein